MRRTALLILAFAVSAGLGAACGKSTASGGGSGTGAGATDSTICDPGENIFCRCPGGEAGTKACKADGKSFEACVTRFGVCPEIPTSSSSSSSSGAGGSGGTTGTGGGGGGPLPGLLYDPCAQDSDCLSSQCRDGYCTKDCAKYDECDLGYGECVQFQDAQFCMPVCTFNDDCEYAYGAPSACGYTAAADGAPVTTCADWESALKLPPAGTNCGADVECDLGHDGVQFVCSKSVCTKGCFSQTDCPLNTTCSSSTALGSCH